MQWVTKECKFSYDTGFCSLWSRSFGIAQSLYLYIYGHLRFAMQGFIIKF